jgi:hypothetical protein
MPLLLSGLYGTVQKAIIVTILMFLSWLDCVADNAELLQLV